MNTPRKETPTFALHNSDCIDLLVDYYHYFVELNFVFNNNTLLLFNEEYRSPLFFFHKIIINDSTTAGQFLNLRALLYIIQMLKRSTFSS